MATEEPDVRSRLRPAVASVFERREGTALLALLVVVALWVYGTPLAQLTELNRLNRLLRAAARVSVVGYGVALLLITGEFDLSVGAMFGITGALAVLLIGEFGLAPWFAMLIVLGFALVFGISQGLVITKLELPSFLVTFASLTLLSGAHRILTGGVTVSADLENHIFDYFGAEIELATLPILGVDGAVPIMTPEGFQYTVPLIHSEPRFWTTFSTQIIWMLVLLAVFHYLLFYTRFGHHVRAVGDNNTSADTTGIDPDLIKIGCFGIASVMAAFAAMMYLGRALTASGATGSGLELLAIAAVVLGGTKLTGGEGSMVGIVLGAVAISMAETLFTLPMGGPPKVITALIILLAIGLGAVRQKFSLARVREWYLTPTAKIVESPRRVFRERTSRTGTGGLIGYLVLSIGVTLVVTTLLAWAVGQVVDPSRYSATGPTPFKLFMEGGWLEMVVQIYVFLLVLVLLALLAIEVTTQVFDTPGDYEDSIAIACYATVPAPLFSIPIVIVGFDLDIVSFGDPMITALALSIPILLLMGTVIHAGVRESHDGSSTEALATVGAVYLAWLLVAAVAAIGLTSGG
jgi:ribose/xylose/arabinose/galactoside ABC-type transport system permease subunit